MATLKEHYSTSPKETLELGKSIGMQSAPNDIILLSGPIGAGKTCLAQGIASGLGFMEYVHSPTFVLIHNTKEILSCTTWIYTGLTIHLK